jgi:hypothetical protein
MAASEFAIHWRKPAAGVDSLSVLSMLAGALIPIYFLDDSVALKAQLFTLLIGVLLVWLFASGFVFSTGSEAWRLAVWCFAAAYSISMAAAVLTGDSATVNAMYPLLFIVFCFRRPVAVRPFFYGLSIGLAALTLFGWYRFITVDGGVISEHALGYWGIKYTEATRNSDALTPAIVTAIAIAGLQQKQAVTTRLLLGAALAIGLPAVILSSSRSAWIAVAAFVFFYGGMKRRMLLHIAAIAVVGGVALMLLENLAVSADGNAALFERAISIVNPNIDSSNLSRSRLLMYAMELGLYNPIVGVGPGHFSAYVCRLGYPELIGAMHPENLFMHLFSEYGIASSVTLLVVLGLACRDGLRATTSELFTAGSAMGALMLWLQMNSELPSLFIWVLLGVITSAIMNHPVPD